MNALYHFCLQSQLLGIVNWLLMALFFDKDCRRKIGAVDNMNKKCHVMRSHLFKALCRWSKAINSQLTIPKNWGL